jgi:hypothetical protein
VNDIEKGELSARLVLHLSPALLRKAVGTEVLAKEGRDVRDPHFFLIVENTPSGTWLVAPLFSKASAGSLALADQHKAGEALSWKTSTSFIFAYQQWLVSDDALIEALVDDNSTSTSRRTYAVGSDIEWADVRAHVSKNDNPARSLT